MAPLSNALLGILAGTFISQARVDSIYWPYISTPLDAIKSKIPLVQRQEGLNFYKINGNQNFDYFLLGSIVLVLISFIGGMSQKPAARVNHLISTLLVSAATVIDIVYSRPLIRTLQKSRVLTAAATSNLYWISIYHGVTLCLLFLTISSQISIEEEFDEDEEKKNK